VLRGSVVLILGALEGAGVPLDETGEQTPLGEL